MKHLICSALFLILFSCSKKENDAILIKDCTGSYLRKDNEDFYITNFEVVEHLESNSNIKVDYKIQKEEDKIFIFSCLMHHETAGFIKITKIK